ncbi:alcohol dehydrogenase [Halobacteriales archaeon QS_8_69_26]|nr:MAG: alcohol dehydrogenase [Halobacteriales archaeon QS_8_69_26]
MEEFRFEYRPGTIRYGPGSVVDLSAELDRIGAGSALVVSGRTVGETPAVVDPVREGLGDRLADVFAETTPDKRVATAAAAADRMAETDADAIVGLGGGSSIDVAKVAAVLAATEDRERAVAEFVRSGSLPVPDGSLPAVVAVPTTLAGADLSQAAGISAGPETAREAGDGDGEVHGGVSDPAVMPRLLCYDPDLVRTTPEGVLLASAMNGFDKAVEAPYARTRTPVTDATAARALGMLSEGLPSLGAGDRDDATMRRVVAGTVLAQYGASRPDGGTLSLIHAFGHALSRPYDVQQGAAHGIAAPHALRYLFDRVDGRRRLLAEGLGVDAPGDDEAVAEAVVAEVERIRDALGLPARLRAVPGLDRAELPAVARAVVDDPLIPNVPPGLEVTVEGIEATLAEAW